MKPTWVAAIAAMGTGACVDVADEPEQTSEVDQDVIIGNEDWEDVGFHFSDVAYPLGYAMSKGVGDIDNGSCTAALIGRDLILTAAHCRRNKTTGTITKWEVDVRFGRERNTATLAIPPGDTYHCPTIVAEDTRFDLLIFRCSPNGLGQLPGDRHTIVPLSRVSPDGDDELYTITNNCRTFDCGSVAKRLLFSPGGSGQAVSRRAQCVVEDDDTTWGFSGWVAPYAYTVEGFETNCDILPGSSGGPVFYRTKDIGIAGLWSAEYDDGITEDNDAAAVWKYNRDHDTDADRLLDFDEYQVRTGDFNNDGRDDLVKFEVGTPAAIRVYLATATGYAPPTVWANWSLPLGTHVAVGDFDGDHRDDIAKVDNGTPGGIWVGVSNGTTTFGTTQWGTWNMSPDTQLVAGFFTDDNREDLVKLEPGAPGGVYLAKSRVVAGANGFASIWWANWFMDATIHVEVGDFDDSGTDDIVKFDNGSPGGVWVGLSQPGGSVVTTKWADWSMDPTIHVLTGDFNADGVDDVAKLDNGAPGGVWVGLSTGAAFPTTKWADWNMSADTQVVAGRFIGTDARTDIMKIDNQQRDIKLNRWIGRSTGAAFVTTNEGPFWIQPQLTLISADYTGDVRHDVVVFGNGPTVTVRPTP